MGIYDRYIEAIYRELEIHTLTLKNYSGTQVYTEREGTVVSVVADPAPAGTKFIRLVL